MTDNMARLKKQKNTCTKRLQNADILSELLGDEGVRWKESVVELNKDIECLVGDTFVSSALISYCSPFTSDFRNKLK